MTLLPNPKPHGIDKSECSLLKEHYALFPPQVAYGIDRETVEMTKTLTEAEMEAAKGPKGGWSRKTLAEWGVPWPPPKGWRRKLLGKTPREPQTPKPKWKDTVGPMWTTSQGRQIPISHMTDDHLEAAVTKLRGWIASDGEKPATLEGNLNLLLAEQERRLGTRWERDRAD